MKTNTNLLSTDTRIRQQLRRFLRQWSVAWIACLVIGGVISANEWRLLRDETQRAAEAQTPHRDVQHILQRCDGIQARIRTLETTRDRYRSVANAGVPMSVLGVLTECAQSVKGPLRLNTLSVRESVATIQGKKAEVRRMMIDIEGTASTGQEVGIFIRHLHATGAFETIELKSSRNTSTADLPGRQFSLQCVLPSPADHVVMTADRPEKSR